MVRFRTPNGYWMHEPPYTKAEEHELYRRMDAGPKTVLRTSKLRKSQEPQKSSKLKGKD
jgi:hypothetical protein